MRNFMDRDDKTFVPAYMHDASKLAEGLAGTTEKINATIRTQGNQTLLHLVGYRADPEPTKSDEKSKLGQGAACIRLLLANDANPKALDLIHRLPLHMIANSSDPDSIAAILEVEGMHEYVEYADDNGRTAIHALFMPAENDSAKAKGERFEKALNLLMSKCKKRKDALTLEDKYHVIPLMYAKKFGYTDVIIKLGFKPEEIADIPDTSDAVKYDYHGRTRLMEIAFEANKQSSYDDMQQELDNGADPNYANPLFGSRTCMHYAAHGLADPEALRILLKHGGLLFAKYAFNRTPLHTAANSGRIDTTKLLLTAIQDSWLDTGIDLRNINAQDVDGNTPLHAAAMATNRPDQRILVIQALIAANADINLRNKAGETALDVARKLGEPAAYIVQFLQVHADLAAVTQERDAAMENSRVWAVSYHMRELGFDDLKKELDALRQQKSICPSLTLPSFMRRRSAAKSAGAAAEHVATPTEPSRAAAKPTA